MPPLLTYSVDTSPQEPSFVTVHLIGELEMASAPGLKRMLAGLSFRWLIVDLGGVTFLDSSGLNLFVALHRECDVTMRRLTFTNVPDRVLRLLELAGIHDLFDIA